MSTRSSAIAIHRSAITNKNNNCCRNRPIHNGRSSRQRLVWENVKQFAPPVLVEYNAVGSTLALGRANPSFLEYQKCVELWASHARSVLRGPRVSVTL